MATRLSAQDFAETPRPEAQKRLRIRRLGLRAAALGCMISTPAKGWKMGGVGSGAPRVTNVGNVEDVLALDIRRLRRLGLARTGECVISDVHWSVDGLRASSARLRVDLSDIERGGSVAIAGSMSGGTVRQTVAITPVPTTIGGWRLYFICPVTAARCEILYYLRGRFASRNAQKLSYAVQSMDELARARRKAAKLRARLSGSTMLPRARGSNRVDVVARSRDAEHEARSLRNSRLRALIGESGARMRPWASS
jgi:hypothetical protein